MTTPELCDYIGIETTLHVWVTQRAAGEPFAATLIREDSRWWDDDPQPDIEEHAVCEHQFAVPLPSLFAELDHWLVTEHRLRVLSHSWQARESGPDVDAVLVLEGRAVPALHITSGPLGCWAA